MPSLSHLGFAYLAAVILFAIVMVPYTKVEESFNMQATHDFLHLDIRQHLQWSLCSQQSHQVDACGKKDTLSRLKCVAGGYLAWLTNTAIQATGAFRLPRTEFIAPKVVIDNNDDFVPCGDGWGAEGTQFDHVQFPGVVPRTFAGAAWLAASMWVWVAAAEAARLGGVLSRMDQGLALQQGIRIVLGMAVALSCRCLAHAAFRRDGRVRGLFYLMVGSCFHVVFYASRTLPNTFALIGVNCGVALLLNGRPKAAFVLLAATAAVLRSDVLVLIAPLAFVWVFLLHRLSLLGGVAAGLLGAGVAVLLTAPFDSLLWGRPLWPEAEVLLFNTVENRSGDWGVSPFHWYFTSAIPKAFLGFTPLVLLAPLLGSFRCLRFKAAVDDATVVGICSLVFVALYSVLPHKEVRFVLIAFPVMLLSAARLGAEIARLPRTVFVRTVAGVAVVLVGVTPFALLGGLQLHAAGANYPGATALQQVNALSVVHPNSHIFIDAYGGMTGVTRFLKLHHSDGLARATYNKDPSLFDFSSGAVEGVKGCDKGFHLVVIRAEWAPLLKQACQGVFSAVSNVTTVDTVLYKQMRFTSKPFLVVFMRKGDTTRHSQERAGGRQIAADQ